MRFKDNFTKDWETSDLNYYDTLRSHYYRARYEEVEEACEQMIDELQGVIMDNNKQFHEILFETPQYTCTIVITSSSVFETSVDFKITTYNLIGFGKGKKVIESFYKVLDSKLQFKGVGLYKE